MSRETSLRDVPITCSPTTVANAELTLHHTVKGKLELKVEHSTPMVFRPGTLALATPAGQQPSVKVAAAYPTENHWSDSGGLLRLASSEAVVDYGPLPAEFTVVCYLSGLSFFEPRTNSAEVAVGGRNWTFKLLEPSTDTGRRLRDEGADLITATVSTDAVREADLPSMREKVDRMMWLLSFANGGNIQLAREDLVAGNAVLRSTLRNTRELDHASLSPLWIDGPFPGLLKKYLEWSFDRWGQHETTYLLKSVVQILLLARTERFLNVKALLVANALEVLRYNYGVNLMVATGRATLDAASDEFNWVVGAAGNPSATKTPKVNFAQILTDMSKHLCLSGWKDDFKKLRNKVMHTSELLGANSREKHRNTMDCLHFCDSVVLALLDWDGAAGDYIPCNEPLDPRPNVEGNNVKPFRR